MGLTHVTVALRGMNGAQGKYESDFLVDTGATDSMAPGTELRKAGIEPVESMVYELADGTIKEYTPLRPRDHRVHGRGNRRARHFGPDDAEPILGVTALESVGILVDPAKKTLKRLPAIPLEAVATPAPPASAGSPSSGTSG